MIVRALSDKRQKAELAQQLYQETAESIQTREAAAAQRKVMKDSLAKPIQRPDKKQRREILKHKANY